MDRRRGSITNLQRWSSLILLALCASWTRAAWAADEVDVWLPQSSWNLDLHPTECLMGRQVSFLNEKALVAFRVEPPSFRMSLLISATGENFLVGPTVKLGTDKAHLFDAPLYVLGTTNAGQTIFRIALERSTLPSLLGSPTLIVESNSRTVMIAFRGSAEALKAVEGCERDLLTSWKIDPAEAAFPATTPKTDKTQWLSNADYPLDAQKAGQQGDAVLAYHISSAGRVDDCRVVGSTSIPSLDAASCRIVRDRARYTPARDETGKPVGSWDRHTIRWRLPKD